MEKSKKKRILVIGMSGLVGGLVGRKLAEQHEVCALNRSRVEGVECLQADIADLNAIRPAFNSVDIVINMASHMSSSGTSDAMEPSDVSAYISTNVIGGYNVFEASRQAGVSRVIYASAGASVFNYVNDEPYRSLAEARWNDVPPNLKKLSHLAPYRPNGVYGASKAWAESLGRYYSDAHRMSVLCIRVGHVPHPPQTEFDLSPYQASIYCSHRDIAQMFELCVTASDKLRFDIFFACSNNRGLFRDINHPREILGYEPQDGITEWPWMKPK